MFIHLIYNIEGVKVKKKAAIWRHGSPVDAEWIGFAAASICDIIMYETFYGNYIRRGLGWHMRIFRKPETLWGWVRAAGIVLLAAVAVWTALAVILRGVGEIPWLAWSGYQNFSFLNGAELAALPLLAVFIAGWLEEHDLRVQAEHTNHREAEQAAAARRARILKQLREAILAELDEKKHPQTEIPAQPRAGISDTILAALPELDGKGKGELLHLLFEKGLLNGANPAVALNGADFGGITMPKAQLNGISMGGIDLRKARLDGAHMEKSILSGANLSKAILRHANLREAALAGSDLSGAHLEHANLEGADLKGARLEGAFLNNASLRNCVMDSPETLDEAILVETVDPDGRVITNEKGKEHLRNKELAVLVDRL